MINFKKPKFWDSKKLNFLSLFLLPFTFLILITIFFKKIFSFKKKFKIPTICIGNIYLGGTGKTPASITLGHELAKLGLKPVILRKYYKSQIDEYKLIQNYFANIIIKRDRIAGLHEAEKGGFDIVVLDDGFQDYRIINNLSIVCFNQKQLIGNGFVIPAGPLRETLTSIKRANVILINGNKNTSFEQKILKINKNLEIFYSYYKPLNINEFKNKELLALAGIGNPENFFQLLEKNNLNIQEKLIFPDHYRFTKNEIENIINKAKKKKLEIIMTEKDFFKIKDFNLKNINYLKISLEINNKEKLIQIIKEKCLKL